MRHKCECFVKYQMFFIVNVVSDIDEEKANEVI